MPPIVVDTREGLPYDFGFAVRDVQVVRDTLQTGDYSIRGYEDRVCVERKTKTDLFGSTGKNRRRFKLEFERMSEFQHAALVIEATMRECTYAPAQSQMNPVAVLNTVIAWGIRYDVQVWFAGSRFFGELLTLRTLEHYWLGLPADD